MPPSFVIARLVQPAEAILLGDNEIATLRSQ